jgi:RNA polymerase sigma-70 factor (ECF subfamily)
VAGKRGRRASTALRARDASWRAAAGEVCSDFATSLQTSAAAARQLASRARKAVEARRPRFPATPEQQRDVVLAFGRAASEGDVDGLMELLHPDVVFTSDGGGIVTAARKPIAGADRVARLSETLARKGLEAGGHAELVDINGMPGWMSVGYDGQVTVMSFTLDDGKIVAIDVQRNPEKLRRLP